MFKTKQKAMKFARRMSRKYDTAYHVVWDAGWHVCSKLRLQRNLQVAAPLATFEAGVRSL